MSSFVTIQAIPTGKGKIRQFVLYRWQLTLIALFVSAVVVTMALAGYYSATVLVSALEAQRLQTENRELAAENDRYRQALIVLDSVRAEQDRLHRIGRTLLGPADSVPELVAARAGRPEGDEQLEEYVKRYRRDAERGTGARPSIKPVIGVVTQRWKENGTDHQGVDIAAILNDPVYAAASGVVTSVAKKEDLGLVVTIEHGEGWSTLYAHLNRALVKKGDAVRRGTSIGTIGMTGNTTGPHLHYEVRLKGEPQDPSEFFMD